MSDKKKIFGASFMAVATGSVSQETQVKLLRGVGAVKVRAINPTRAEYNDILKTNTTGEEFKYLAETTVKDKDGNDKKVPQIRISFLVETDPNKACNNGIHAFKTHTIFLNKAYNFSKKNDVTKIQVIDIYGRTAWVTPEELKDHIIPEYKITRGEHAGEMMKAQLDKNYRPCYIGEEELVKTIIAFLCIDRPDTWNESLQTYVMKTDPKELEKSQCMLDDINNYFSGNIKELVNIFKRNITMNNEFKLCFGIRTSSNGTQYQCTYTRMPMRLSVNNYSTLDRALKADEQAGRHPSENYSTENLEEVVLGATDYSKKDVQEKKEEDPFATVTPSESPEVPMPEDDLPPANIEEDPFSL